MHKHAFAIHAAPQDRIVLPAMAAAPNPAQRPAKFRLLDRDGIAAAGEVLTQGGTAARLAASGCRQRASRCSPGPRCVAMPRRFSPSAEPLPWLPHSAPSVPPERPDPPNRCPTCPAAALPQARCW